MAVVLQTMSQEGSGTPVHPQALKAAAGEELLTGTSVQTQVLEVTAQNVDRVQPGLYGMHKGC